LNGPLKPGYEEQVDTGRVYGERDEWDSRGAWMKESISEITGYGDK